MLALRRLRCLLPSTPAYQTRQLRTQPRPIPRYTRQWNPTLHNSLNPLNGPNEPFESAAPAQPAPEPDLPDDLHDRSLPASDPQSSSKKIVINLGNRRAQDSREVKRLEYWLNHAKSQNTLKKGLRAALWNAYILAMKRKASLPKYMPREAWVILWKSQYADFSDVSRRQVRLAKLDRDMRNARAVPIPGQIALRAEKRFMAGMQEDAFDMWLAHHNDNATAPEYLDTGIRLYALAGYPDLARKFLDKLIQLEPEWDLSVTTAVFRAYTASLQTEHHDKAKTMYRSMKARMSSDGDLEIYDACMVGFLDSRSLEDAMQVFRDMIYDGCLKTDGSQLNTEGVIQRLNLLYALAPDVSKMTSIALDAIDVLPVAYHGHIFSDWLKSTVLETAPQAAAHILDMMIQRGYKPETEHFNSLLRILFRTKEPANVLKAESIGWKMIEEARLSSIASERPSGGSRVNAIVERLQNTSVLNAASTISMPAASTTTFAMIMRHHAAGSQWEHVNYLARQLRETNVPTNSTIMNVLIENKGQQGKFVEAWQIYKSLTDDPDQAAAVFPDGESIRVLWRTLRLALVDPENRTNPNLPTPRQLLRETFDWWILVRQRPDVDRFLQGLAAADLSAITKLVLHCFSYARDVPGVLVALHFLRENFGIYTTGEHVQTVLRQLAWTALDHESESVRIQFGLGKNRMRAMKKMVQTYKQSYVRRLHRMGASQEDLLSYRDDEICDLQLNVLSEFVRVVLLAEHSPEEVEQLIQDAATAAGVPSMSTGDMNVFDLMSQSGTETD